MDELACIPPLRPKPDDTSFMSSYAIRALEPKTLWNCFADLNAVPRPSKREERVVGFVLGFAAVHGLSAQLDSASNVIIKKPASADRQGRAPVIMQAHLDMVHKAGDGVKFDFDKQGIDMWVDGDWVRARKEDGCPYEETPEQLEELKKSFPKPRDAVSYIMDTFPIVKRKDEEKWGSYRTKEMILGIYDEMQGAIRTGGEYRTRLEPAPGDPRCCHPARAENAN